VRVCPSDVTAAYRIYHTMKLKLSIGIYSGGVRSGLGLGVTDGFHRQHVCFKPLSCECGEYGELLIMPARGI
jgi:hypothetical protein